MCILTLKKECQRIYHQTWYFVTEWVPFVTGTAGRVSVTAHTEDSRTAEISGGKRQGSAAPWRQQGEHWTGGNQVDISWSTRCIMTLLWMVEPRDEKPSQGWKKADVNYDAVYVRVDERLMLTMMWSSFHPPVPEGWPSCGGNVAVYVFDINQPSLLAPFYSALVSVSVFRILSTVFLYLNSPDNSAFSLCSSDLISAVLVLSTRYLVMKVSFSPDIILCGWLDLKHWLTS